MICLEPCELERVKELREEQKHWTGKPAKSKRPKEMITVVLCGRCVLAPWREFAYFFTGSRFAGRPVSPERQG